MDALAARTCRRSTRSSASGELAPLRDWLREHIHRHGRKFPPRELLLRATGDTLRPEPFLDYLRAKLVDAGAL